MVVIHECNFTFLDGTLIMCELIIFFLIQIFLILNIDNNAFIEWALYQPSTDVFTVFTLPIQSSLCRSKQKDDHSILFSNFKVSLGFALGYFMTILGPF